MEMIYFLCPWCARRISIDKEGAGEFIKCPYCNLQAKVPAESTEKPPPAKSIYEPPPSPQPLRGRQPMKKNRKPVGAIILTVVGVLCFCAGMRSLILAFAPHPDQAAVSEAIAWFVISAFSCGFSVIAYLARIAAAARKTNELLDSQVQTLAQARISHDETNKALQWMIDNWSARR